MHPNSVKPNLEGDILFGILFTNNMNWMKRLNWRAKYLNSSDEASDSFLLKVTLIVESILCFDNPKLDIILRKRFIQC